MFNRKPKLTIGFAAFDDFYGLWPTIQALRIQNKGVMHQCEIIVVDNNPAGSHAAPTKDLVGWVNGAGDVTQARYITLPTPVGTSAPRQMIFDEAEGDYVLCMDSHILLDDDHSQSPPLARLLNYYDRNPDTRDLLQGPMLYDGLKTVSTHWDDVWRSEMWGTWNTDPRGDPTSTEYSDDPFEIFACGLGVFTCSKAAWKEVGGFNPKFRGFGGEEGYIHTKFRQHGHKCLCLPWFRWAHRFGRPTGVKYPLSLWDKARNYAIGHAELGLPFERMTRHFLAGLDEQGNIRTNETGLPVTKFPVHEWDAIFKDPSNPPERMPGAEQSQFAAPQQQASGGCSGCSVPAETTLEQLYARARDTASDCNEHLPKLRELATGANRVAAFGGRAGMTTLALLSGHPRLLESYDPNPEGVIPILYERRDQTDLKSIRQRSEVTTLEGEYDLIFICTHHSANQLYTELRLHAPHAKRVVMNGTQVYGETGEDGSAGLLPALRKYMKDHPEWSVIYHAMNNNGFTVISKDPADKKELPSLTKMAWNYAKAKVAHWREGNKILPDEHAEARLDVCIMCPQRTDGVRCSVCGCFLDEVPDGIPGLKAGPGRAFWGEAVCPLGKWEETDKKFSLQVVEVSK